MVVRVFKGLDLPIAGAPAESVVDGPPIGSIAILGEDYRGLSPAMRVEEGERVKLGQPLFVDRKRPEICFTSPGSGVVAEINRGARRMLLSVAIRLDGEEEETFPAPEDPDRGQAAETLLASGMWTAFRARPFDKIPDPAVQPRSIFVTAIDTNPLAPAPERIIKDNPDHYLGGLAVLSKLTDGTVFVCRHPNAELPVSAAENVREELFNGPHPAGLPGTHIHYLDPVGSERIVWHIGYQDVIAIGHLFATGRLMTERTIALAGPMVRSPCLLKTRFGAGIDDITRGALRDGAARIISGSVLSGHTAKGATAYLGRFHNQVSVIPEELPDMEKKGFSIYRGFGAKPWGAKRTAFTTAPHGGTTAQVPFGGFERVMPLDILPTQLLRALQVGDVETAEALGCLELAEEDLALCTLVCPGKLDFGPILRSMLDRLEREG